MKTWFYRCATLLMFALPLLAMTCNEDYGGEDNREDYYNMGKDGKVHYSYLSTIREEQFIYTNIKEGWRLYKSTIILTSEQTNDELLVLRYGISPMPHDLYFDSRNQFTVFEYQKDKNLLRGGTYQYDEKTNSIVNEVIPYMVVLIANPDRLETLESAGFDEEDHPIYVHNMYIKMNDYELNSRWLSFKGETE